MDKTSGGRAPGLFYVNSKITQPRILSREAYLAWYNDHFQDIFKTGAIKEAFLWEALDPSSERPVLCTYPMSDVGLVYSEQFQAMPVEHPNLPGNGKILELASFDTRIYAFSQLFEPEAAMSGQSDLLLAVAFTPANDEEYDRWYREEHLHEVSAKIPGWRKTERYTLEAALLNGVLVSKNPPKFLTLHYLDGEAMPEKELADLAEGEWTKKMMSTMKEAEYGMFKRTAHVTA